MELRAKEEDMTLSGNSGTPEMAFCTTLTAPEYILSKTDHWTKTGKTIWAADAISGETHEFGSFEENTRRIASWFRKRGMDIGDTLIYMSKELINMHTLMTGVWRANGNIRSTYPEDTEETVLSIVIASRAKWIVCDQNRLQLVESVANKVADWDLEVIVIGRKEDCNQTSHTTMKNLLSDYGDKCPELKIKPEDIALILPTSGTTGNSKGVALSHFAIISFIEMSSETLWPVWTDSMNFFLCKSIHSSGSSYPLSCLCSGKPCLFISEITNETLQTAVEKYKPGTLVGFTPYMTALANNAHTIDATSVQNVITGGTPVGPSVPETLKQFPNFKKLIILYGMTEANFLAIHNVDLDALPPNGSQPLSVGKVAPYTRIQFRNTESGELCEPNQQGELRAKTSHIFTRYIGLPEETAAAFADDWLRTGDLGYFDEKGFIYINGRIKEMFKSYGCQILPSEIDEIVSRHPDVASVCTIGVPDSESGDKIPRVYVTLKQGCTTSPNDIMDFAHGFLASYKYLKGGVIVVPELPRGSSGKITRSLVEQKFLTNSN